MADNIPPENKNEAQLDNPAMESNASFFAGQAEGIAEMTALLATQNDPDSREALKLLAQLETLVAFYEAEDDILDADHALGEHLAEYEALHADPVEFNRLAFTLFQRPEFIPLRFDAGSVQHLFERTGYPPLETHDGRVILDFVRRATLLLSTPRIRRDRAMRLVRFIPGLVEAGEYSNAWIVHLCAAATSEEETRANPFLLQMFLAGLGEWAAQVTTAREELIGALGIDLADVPSPGSAAFEDWIATNMEDPARRRLIETYLDNHPEFDTRLDSEIDELVNASVVLPGRADFAPYLLTAAETAPEIATLNLKVASLSFAEGSDEPDEAFMTRFQPILMETTEQAIARIFDASRKERLRQSIKQYQRAHHDDPRTFSIGQGGILSLAHYKDIENPFLIAYVMVSLQRAWTS